MTAVVAILNKHAVAIAADSAVTIGGTQRKIFNKALKIFTLSKYEPVGVMIYNNATLMSTPWEIIIKMYRKKLKDSSFNTLNEYQQDFISYIREMRFFADTETQKHHIASCIHGYLEQSNLVVRRRFFNGSPIPKAAFPAFLIKLKELWTEVRAATANNPRTAEFADYTLNQFSEFVAEVFPEILDLLYGRFEVAIDDETKQLILETLFAELFHEIKNVQHTGIVFVGYGLNDVYPALVAVDIDFAIGERLKYRVCSESEAQITNVNAGAIRPFAQDDVMNTILSGVDPALEDSFYINLRDLIQKYNQDIIDRIGDTNPVLTQMMKLLNIEDVVNQYRTRIDDVKQKKYIDPLMIAVASLAKEDLAEMAESLIYLTYLKRHITNAEESVGGPVDVAIISKGDGFIWIKRKHYFKPELNKTFFSNYLKA